MAWVIIKCLSMIFFFMMDTKKVLVYKKKRNNFIYDLQVIPINCDYEILSPLMWVVVNIWALPYWTILVLFVYFWNKMMFKMDVVVEGMLLKDSYPIRPSIEQWSWYKASVCILTDCPSVVVRVRLSGWLWEMFGCREVLACRHTCIWMRAPLTHLPFM